MFGALLVAVLLSLASVTLSRSNLLDQRERVGVARAAVNAAAIGDKIVVPDVDAQTLFGSLSVSGKPSALDDCLQAVFPAIPYCLDLIDSDWLESDPSFCAAFRPAHARKR